MTRTSDYYDTANYGDDILLRGTGVVGLLTGDQLHPPMVDDPAIWSNSKRWREGAEESVRRLASNARIRRNDRVLDVGCGVGGATRLLRREFGAYTLGLNISEEQLHTARRLSQADAYVKADARHIPLAASSVDCVITINMFYHVADKAAALREMLRVTRPGGTLAFDDWVVTERATLEDRAQLLEHWNPEPVAWITDVALEAAIHDVGYRIERLDDFAHVGSGVMRQFFEPTFEREVRPLIIAADRLHGELVADHFRSAVDHTIRLYTEGKMRYLQIIARRLPANALLR